MREAPWTRRGAAALELALILPFLVALLSGLVDYGWYLTQEAEVVECVRDAARAGVGATSDEDPETLAQARLEEALTRLGQDPATASILVETQVDSTLGADVLVVTVSLPYAGPMGLVPCPDTLGASASMLVPA